MLGSLANTETEALTAAKARIAELEAACEKAEYELDWHSDELRKLEAENMRLREALTSIEGAASYSRRVWIIETAQTALLGEAQ